MFLSLFAMMGTGTFHADTYYLPLREFVPESQQEGMESRVIDIFNEHQRTFAFIWLIRDAVCFGCLVMARRIVARAD